MRPGGTVRARFILDCIVVLTGLDQAGQQLKRKIDKRFGRERIPFIFGFNFSFLFNKFNKLAKVHCSVENV